MKRILPILICLTSCSTNQHTVSEKNSSGKTTNSHTRTWIPAADARRVQSPDFIKTYHLGRTPNQDGSVMHEAHQVYEIGQSSTWNLAPGAVASNGPVIGLIDDASVPRITNREIEAELSRQREITDQLLAAKDDLIAIRDQATAKLNAEVPRIRQAPRSEPAEPATQGPPPASTAETLLQWGQTVDEQ